MTHTAKFHACFMSFISPYVTSIGYVVGACLSIMIADKFERKYQFVVAGLIMGIAFILRGLFIQDYLH